MAFPHKREEFYDVSLEDPKTRPSLWFIEVARYVVRPAAWVVTRFEVKGKENIPEIGEAPVVFAANHMSYMDPVVLWCSMPKRVLRFLARETLFKPVLGGLIARAGGIPVQPDSADRKAVKRAAAALKRGECVGIFPEGTRMNKPNKVYKPHAGMVLIAQMGKAKIVPVGINGTERIRPYGKKLIRFPKVYVSIGEPIDLADYSDLPKSERTQAILDATMEKIFELRDNAPTR